MSIEGQIEGKASHNSCDFCPQNYGCGVLKTALQVLSSYEQYCNEASFMMRLEEIRRDLQESGYSYPVGEKACALAANKSNEAILTKVLAILKDYTIDYSA
jgi:hypothetical protein